MASSIPTRVTPATNTSTPGRSHTGRQAAALKLSCSGFVRMAPPEKGFLMLTKSDWMAAFSVLMGPCQVGVSSLPVTGPQGLLWQAERAARLHPGSLVSAGSRPSSSAFPQPSKGPLMHRAGMHGTISDHSPVPLRPTSFMQPPGIWQQLYFCVAKGVLSANFILQGTLLCAILFFGDSC